MPFTVRKPGAGAVTLDDLGITLSGIAASEFDLRNLEPTDVSDSGDLASAISGATLVVLDPRDNSTALSIADGTLAQTAANDSHFGISGGRFGPLDDPGTSLSDNFLVQYDLSGDVYESVDPATIIGDQTEVIEDIVGAMGVNGTDTTFTYNDGAGTIEWSVDDVFLRNTGDTLDSGTLTIASGATVDFPSGSSLTIAGAVTAATIETPGGGFVNDNDLINKFYVDQIAAAIDWKESVRVSTTPADGDITAGLFGGVYAAGGGPTGTGQFTGVDLSSGTGDSVDGLFFTGVASTGFIIGDRFLIKDQTDATQNGIYFIDSGSVAASVILTRATDQDGSPSSEVSGGNTTFVEDTTAINATSVNSNTAWSVLFDGELTLNTDDMDWIQIAGPGAIVAGLGLSRDGSVIDLDVDDLANTAITTSDSLAFHDADGAASASGSQTRKRLLSEILADLDIVNSLGGNGFAVQTGADTYTARSITVDGAGNLDGLVVADGDGVAGDPTLGLDIQNLPARSTAVDTTDRVAVWRSDGTDANEYYLISEIAGAVGASDSFSTWARTGNGSGASLVADSSADTVTLDGGIGIDLTTTPASDTISFAFTNSGMADTAVEGADTVPFFDSGNSFEPEFRSWTNIISDLGILTAVTASADEDELGIVVTGGDTIGFTIDTLTNPVEDMTATDEFAVHNKSEGTAGANRKITGQEIADGVSSILNISTLGFAVFPAVTTPAEDQTLLAFDEDRGSGTETYSVESQTYQWSDNSVRDNDWIAIGDAVDADSGWIMPLQGTVVAASAHTEDTGGGNTYELDLYIDAVDSGAIATLTGGADVSDSDPTLDLPFTAGQKLRIRGDRTAGTGNMGDMTIAVTVRWRV